MITTPALVFATVAFSAVCSFSAPIKVRRDGSDVQQIGRRFPQTIAADSPALVKKEVVDAPVADAIVRRFPRRVYYEYYNKRDTPEVVERSPAPESDPEARSIADEASDDLTARKRRREMRRSTDSTRFRRTLTKDGVRARREEPKVKRSVVSQPVVAREPEPKPAPVIESRAFIPPIAARDTFIWKINAGGIKIEDIIDVEQIQKISGLPTSSSSSNPTSTGSSAPPPSNPDSQNGSTVGTSSGGNETVTPPPTGSTNGTTTGNEGAINGTTNGTTTGNEGATNGTTNGNEGTTNSNGGEPKTPPTTENPPATATTGGKGGEGSSTPTPTTTSSSSTTSGTSTDTGSKSPDSGTTPPCTNPTGCPTPSDPMSTDPPREGNTKVMDTTAVPPTPSPNKRDEQPPLVLRSGSMHWRRIPTPPSPPLSRRSESASSKLQYRRDYS